MRRTSNCIIEQALTWKIKKDLPKNTLCWEMDTDKKRMNSTWEQLIRKSHDRVGFRLLVGGF